MFLSGLLRKPESLPDSVAVAFGGWGECRAFLTAPSFPVEKPASMTASWVPAQAALGLERNVISSLVSVHQRAMRSHLSAEFDRVPLRQLRLVAGSAA